MKTLIQIIGMLVLTGFVNPATYKPSDIIINNAHEVYIISVDNKEKLFDWNPIIKTELVIPLETNSNSAFGYLYKGCVFKDKIVLFDRMNSNLLVFDNKGKFLFKVGNKGKGPGEYLGLRDFMIADDTLYSLDYKRIHCYDVTSGKYKSSINIETAEMNPSNFLIFNNKNYYLWDSNPHITNTKDVKYMMCKIEDGKLKARYFKYNHMSMSMDRFYKRTDGSFYLQPIDGEYDVYKITKDSISISFILDFKKKNLPKNYFSKNPIDINNEYFKSDYYKNIDNIFETKDYIYFSCIGPQARGYEGLINKKSKQISFGKRDFSCSPEIFYSDGNYLYGYYLPTILLKEPVKKSQNYFFDAIKDSLKDLKIEDNIVIVKFSLKDKS